MSEVATKYGAPGLPIVNLIPPDIEEKRKLRQVQSLCLLIIAGVVGLVAFLFIGATTAKNLAKGDLDDAARDQKVALADRDSLNSVLDDYRRYENKQFAIAQAGWGEIDYSQMFRSLLATVGPNTFISAIEIRTPAADIYPTDSLEIMSPLGIGSVTIDLGGTVPSELSDMRDRLAATPGIQWVVPRKAEWTKTTSDERLVWANGVSASLTQELLTERFFPTGTLEFNPVEMARTGLARFEELVAEQAARNSEAEAQEEEEAQ